MSPTNVCDVCIFHQTYLLINVLHLTIIGGFYVSIPSMIVVILISVNAMHIHLTSSTHFWNTCLNWPGLVSWGCPWSPCTNYTLHCSRCFVSCRMDYSPGKICLPYPHAQPQIVLNQIMVLKDVPNDVTLG